jgi:hypothetical protein
MPQYRRELPQLKGSRFLTDGGLEATLIFQDNIHLPALTAFVMLESEEKSERLRLYYGDYMKFKGEITKMRHESADRPCTSRAPCLQILLSAQRTGQECSGLKPGRSTQPEHMRSVSWLEGETEQLQEGIPCKSS